MRQLDGRGFIKDAAGPRTASGSTSTFPPATSSWCTPPSPRRSATRASSNSSTAYAASTAATAGPCRGPCRCSGEDGEIDEWIGAASDITERKLAEEKLRELDRRKDEFLAMLAHELRNPLAPIGAAADLLQRARPRRGPGAQDQPDHRAPGAPHDRA
jgi:PAS domain-containing protein